ncbi:MAG: insulinase family protein, partial [Lachnospiraceae bacterium]|nr:insulinase family protein [Lachnospiraceae bacterium]
EIEKDFDGHYASLVEGLKKTADIILKKENLMVDFTGSRKVFEKAVEKTAGFTAALGSGKAQAKGVESNGLLNEGIKTASMVQYVARSGNFKDAGLDYTGALKVLKVIMGYEYLWNNVRVKGGAYGCMNGFSRNGECYMVSYRDPHLKNTIKIFEEAAEYIEGFDVSERDMTKFIIGTISNIDTPLPPAAKGQRSFNAYMSGVTQEDIQKDRDEVLSTGVKEIRALSKYLEALCKSGALCVIGGEEKIGSSKELFNTTRSLS